MGSISFRSPSKNFANCLHISSYNSLCYFSFFKKNKSWNTQHLIFESDFSGLNDIFWTIFSCSCPRSRCHWVAVCQPLKWAPWLLAIQSCTKTNTVALKRQNFSVERMQILEQAQKILRFGIQSSLESLPQNEDITKLIESQKNSSKYGIYRFLNLKKK